jgi:poly-beta-1,6-N-acetyl-D-glucosamine synthase
MESKYVIVSAVRNEEDYIEKTLEAVTRQTVLPLQWVLVNDGSSDNTARIIESYENKYQWIKRIDLEDRGHYLPGEGIVKAFYKGFELVKNLDWKFLIKMDCDLSFDSDYFERLLNEFSINPDLGIASGGIYNVISEEKIIKEKGKPDHPWGASIMFRRECFEQIGGLQATLGWELASIINAQINGWTTKCYFELIVYHYRLTGNRHGGFTRGRMKHGRNLYRFGYPFYYTILKGINRLFEPPYIIGGAAIILGHMIAALSRDPFIYNKRMRQHLRKRLRVLIASKIPGNRY